MKVKFSILVPLYNTPKRFLRDMIESVQNQTCKSWELCLADASDDEHGYVGEIVEEYKKSDSRILYKKLILNEGISENTNACIDFATGNYIALLDHDDILDKKALREVEKVIRNEKADFVYTDEAKFTNSISEWFAPNYKPDFSMFELRAHNYICHLTVYSKELLDQVGRYRKECDGSQDHDMVLRLSEKAKKIVHIPKILYYWRVHTESVADRTENKSYVIDAAKMAVHDHVLRSGYQNEVITHPISPLLYHVLYEIKGMPKVTVVLYGTKKAEALKRCIESVEFNSGYDNIQYLILTKADLISLYRECLYDISHRIHTCQMEICDWDDKEQVNQMMKACASDYLLFLNMDCRLESDGFIKELLGLAQQKEVAFVGTKIYTKNGQIKHAGIALTKAMDNGVVFRFQGEQGEANGYGLGLQHIRNVTAVSDECMMIAADKFTAIGGFSKEFTWYSAIDICLKARACGFENIWTPYAKLISFETQSEASMQETNRFLIKWREAYEKEDPYYHKAVRYDVDNIHDKNTPVMLYKKSMDYLREEGIRGLMERISVYRGGSGHHSSTHLGSSVFGDKKYCFKDVLFINGCAPSVPHPPRYRVTHQREQLEAAGITTDEVYYENLDPDLARYYRTFVIFRCPYTDAVGKLIHRAHDLNKKVIFDVDDLVIDTEYTDTIPYVMGLDAVGKAVYDDGVIRMGKTLKMCDAAITTTEGLAQELKKYVPEVFINRNTASERMYELSERAIYKRDILPVVADGNVPAWMKREELKNARKRIEERKNNGIRIGYFSGSITHNEDFKMILPAVVRVLKENPSVKLHIVGELDLPDELDKYRQQVVAEPFVDWEKLPDLIASVDINLAPITKSIFNDAKSENKWVEAALVKVPTVASDTGAFKRMIRNRETGILCGTTEEWYHALTLLILDGEERKRLAEAAYEFAKKECITIYTGRKLAEYIQKKFTKNIVFVFPSLNISGGILVALKHLSILKKAGCDVLIIDEDGQYGYVTYENDDIPVISLKNTEMDGWIDLGVATLWSTLDFLNQYKKVHAIDYLVQNYETDFYEPNDPSRLLAEKTYYAGSKVRYLTISKWCEEWLETRYGKTAVFIPNGIDANLFYPIKRNFDGKIRILIEGNSSSYYKNVDESFRIVEKLDKEKFEIWYLSYDGKPKEWYHVDQFFNRVPHEDVADIYRQCHILLKTSILESFSYPPLEMMATGGYAVVVPNCGNQEYLKDGYNCLLYKQGDLDAAVQAIQTIAEDSCLRNRLYEGGIATAEERAWKHIESDIVRIYLDS